MELDYLGRRGWTGHSSGSSLRRSRRSRCHETIEDETGPWCLDNTVLKHFDYSFVTNSREKLLRKTAILLKCLLIYKNAEHPNVEMRSAAVTFWMRAAMPATWKAGKEGKLRDLTPVKHHICSDLLVVRGQAEEGMKRMYGVKFLPILMSSTRTAQMVMLWAHEQDHAGVEYTYATSMQVAWIVGGRTLAKKIKNLCMRCRFLRKQLEGQKISILPPGIPVPEDHPDRCAEAGADCTSGGARGD